MWLARTQGAAGWEKLVALKTILPHLAAQDGFIERFLDEARIATTLTHGNIVPVFEFGQDQDTYFLAMEYVDGWDLRTLMRRMRTQQDPLPEDLALYIGAEVCRGLDYAHQRLDASGNPSPIIHRDISPSNILVSKDGEVRLVDFGIASARERLGTTLTGELRGKIAYMSPEQAQGNPVDPRSDLFSLGTVLYEALAGVRPFEGNTDMEVLHRVQQSEYTPLREHRDDLCEATYQLIDTALQQKPSDRFADASAMQMQMLDILYHKTGPVSARQLATFCAKYDRKTYDSGIRPGQSFDDLLQAQLLSAQDPPPPTLDDLRDQTPPRRTTNAAVTRTLHPTPTPLPAAHIRAASDGQTPPPDPNAAQRPAAPADESTGVRRYRRRRRTVIGAIIVVLLLILVASILAFQLGTRSGQTAPVVRVHTEPSGALIYFNGVSYGRSTLIARPAPGEWLVRAELDGYHSDERSIVFEGDQDLDLHLALQEQPTDDPTDSADTTADDATRPEPALHGPFLPADSADPLDTQPSNTAHDADGTSATEPVDEDPPATARVRTHGLPPKATVRIDGRRQPNPSTLRVPIDQRVRIDVSAPGYQSKSFAWRTASARDSLDLALTPQSSGTLTVRFIGDVLIGEVWVDDTSYGRNDDAPRTRVKLPVGEHTVRVTNPSLDLHHETTVEIQEDTNTTVTVDWSAD